MNKINEITKNNERFNELQALMEERNSKLITQLSRMSEIHDSVARKILIGRSYKDYLNYKKLTNSTKYSSMFIGNNIEIINVTDRDVTISIVEPACYYYDEDRIVNTFRGGTFTKSIRLSYFSLSDRELAKKSRVKVYNYLMNIENSQMRDLHQSDLADEKEIINLESQINALRQSIKDRQVQISHRNHLRKSYELRYYNKLYGNELSEKNRECNYPSAKNDTVISNTIADDKNRASGFGENYGVIL